MKLSVYLAENNLSDADFAAAIGVTRQAVHRYRTGERIPDQPTMAKIVEAANGAVTPNDFFNVPTPEAAS
jgi:putative transcriptional regulator